MAMCFLAQSQTAVTTAELVGPYKSLGGGRANLERGKSRRLERTASRRNKGCDESGGSW
jgi:hypothetical protein